MLKNKVVAVTGGSSGIGRAIAIRAAQNGARAVIIADLRDTPREGGASTLAAIESAGAAALFHRTDVSSTADIESLLAASEALGGVDLMVCNAGIAVPNDGPDLAEDDYRRLVSVNLDGAYFSARMAGLQMRRLGKAGAIVITSSMGGLRGSAQTVAYSTIKGGLCLMAASLADSFGPDGIRVNAVCPGVIETALMTTSPEIGEAVERFRLRTPLRRWGQPEEIGDVVVWLGSDMSSFVTGVSLAVDGGLTAVL